MTPRIRGSVIMLAMLEKGWGVSMTCERARINNHTLAKARDGQMVRIDALKRLADALGLEPRELLDFGEPEQPRLRAVK